MRKSKSVVFKANKSNDNIEIFVDSEKVGMIYAPSAVAKDSALRMPWWRIYVNDVCIESFLNCDEAKSFTTDFLKKSNKIK